MKTTKSIYILEAIHPEIHQDGRKGHYLKNKDGSIKCYKETIGVFDSIKEAEKVIRILVKNKDKENKRWDSWEKYVGFILDEHYVNNALYGKELSNVSHFESCRSYLNNGKLNCISECDDRCIKKFNGRKHKQRYVKKGDIALLINNNDITPILIEELSMTKKEWKKRFKKNVYGDYTDDSCIAYTSNYGHIHPFSPTVFPLFSLPYIRIPKKEINKMLRERRLYLDDVK